MLVSRWWLGSLFVFVLRESTPPPTAAAAAAKARQSLGGGKSHQVTLLMNFGLFFCHFK